MELRIDIPEEVYSDIQKGIIRKHIDKVYVAIANGIPYNPTGDAISREALKKYAIPCQIHNGASTDLCVPLYQIDNASPVPLPDFKAGYKQAILDGKTNFSRPQGEWLIVGRVMKNGKPLAVRCSECNKSPKYAVESDFCPNCGADMRGEE